LLDGRFIEPLCDPVHPGPVVWALDLSASPDLFSGVPCPFEWFV
jgi:hypothetical protein